MNSKIPVRQFAEKIVSECNVSPEVAQQFVKSYFDNVIGFLRKGENVEIPGLGRFLLTHNLDAPVVFEPDVDAAAEINAPFGMFEPMELPAGVSEEDLSGEDESKSKMGACDISDDIPQVVEQVEVGKLLNEDTEPINLDANAVEEITETHLSIDNLECQEPTECKNACEPEFTNITSDSECEYESEIVPTASSQPEMSSEDKYSSYIPEDEEEYVQLEDVKKGHSFGLGFLVGILTGLIIGAVALYVYVMCYVNMPMTIE